MKNTQFLLNWKEQAQMNKGKQFEQYFQKSVPKGVYCLRLTDSSPAGFGGNENMRFSIQSPYDFILFNGQMFALELKSTKQKSISFAGSSPMIKPHQVKALTKAHDHGITAGFLFNFQNIATYFIPIDKFNSYVATTTRKSVPICDCNALGYEIPMKKLKVNFRYDLTRLLKGV